MRWILKASCSNLGFLGGNWPWSYCSCPYGPVIGWLLGSNGEKRCCPAHPFAVDIDLCQHLLLFFKCMLQRNCALWGYCCITSMTWYPWETILTNFKNKKSTYIIIYIFRRLYTKSSVSGGVPSEYPERIYMNQPICGDCLYPSKEGN